MSKREKIGKPPTISKHYFIYSIKNANAEEILRIKREHWAIENNLHWTLDVIFREDDSRARLENAAENLNILRKQALQLMKQETTMKRSMKRLGCELRSYSRNSAYLCVVGNEDKYGGMESFAAACEAQSPRI